MILECVLGLSVVPRSREIDGHFPSHCCVFHVYIFKAAAQKKNENLDTYNKTQREWQSIKVRVRTHAFCWTGLDRGVEVVNAGDDAGKDVEETPFLAFLSIRLMSWPIL